MPKTRKLGIDYKEEQITKLFKHALLNKGWTQTHLSELTRMDKEKINRIINHPMKRNFGDVFAVAEKLGVDIPT